MTYYKRNVFLSDGQLRKMNTAGKDKEAVTLRIDPAKKGNVSLYVTQRQINKMSDGLSHDITLSKSQMVKNGGFVVTIPAILAGLSLAATAAGAASNIAKTVNQKKHETRVEKESKRHNNRVEQLLSAKSGRGAFLPKKKF